MTWFVICQCSPKDSFVCWELPLLPVAMHIHCLNQILCLFAAADLNSINESSFSLFSFQLSMRDDHAAEINKSLVSSSSGKETEHQHHKILINKQSIGIRPTPRRSSMMIPMTWQRQLVLDEEDANEEQRTDDKNDEPAGRRRQKKLTKDGQTNSDCHAIHQNAFWGG